MLFVESVNVDPLFRFQCEDAFSISLLHRRVRIMYFCIACVDNFFQECEREKKIKKLMECITKKMHAAEERVFPQAPDPLPTLELALDL